MKAAGAAVIALVTAPDLKTARKLARLALEGRLVACVNLVPRIESHFWWQGKLETGSEVLMLLKTTTARMEALERLVSENHPYDTPEFLIVPVNRATERYLKWWCESVA